MLRERRMSIPIAITISLGLLFSGCGLDASQRENGQIVGTPTARTYEAYLASRRWTGPVPTQIVGDQTVFSVIENGIAPSKQVIEMYGEEEISEDMKTVKLRIQSGDHEYVLGEEGGKVKPGAKGARSFAWFNFCQPCAGLERGLYVLDLETGNQTHVASRASDTIGSVLISEPWVVYYAIGGEYPRTLQAHNLETGEDFTLDQDPPYGPTGPRGGIALNEGAVAWEG